MKKKEQKIKDIGDTLTKKELADLYCHLYERHIDLVKWLYDNHKDILRKWEKTQGKLQIEFLGGKK